MRNLKRVLSTIMAVAMMMSLVVFSASAAFSDQDKIVNTEAVNMNVALNIINGMPDGSFNPTGNVTRAEMAKMICILLNGGTEPAVSAKSGAATFTDIRGHWAEGYIESCVAMGIVAGMGDGTFQPNGNVTATQAAKMLLVALGYDAAFEGFNGANWNVRINVAASQKNLYEDVTMVSVNNPLSRDNAAQMVWNALQAEKVKYTYSLTTVDGSLQNVQVREDVKDLTLLKDRYKTADDVEGIMTGYTWLSNEKKFSYEIGGEAKWDATGSGAWVWESGVTFKSAQDFTHLFQMTTVVVHKENGNTVYGMYAKDAKVLATGVLGDLEADGSTGIKFDGTKYKLDTTDATTTVYAENVAILDAADSTLTKGTFAVSDVIGDLQVAPYTAKLIDDDNDGKVDRIVYLPFTVEKVIYVDNKEVSTDDGDYAFDDYEIYSDAKKNDWTMVVTTGSNAAKVDGTLTKITPVTGKITAIKDSGNQIVIGGVTYTNNDALNNNTSYAIGDEMELIVANGYIFNEKKTAGTVSSDKLALVILADEPGAAGTTDAGKQSVQLLLADGTKKVVKVAKIDGTTINSVNATTYFTSGSTPTGDQPLKSIWSYTVNKDGNYELKSIAGNYDDMYTAANAATLKSGKITANNGTDTKTIRFADEAVIFYVAGGSYKVATGSAVNSWAETTLTAASDLYTNETSGFQYAQTGFLALTSAPSDKDTKYGYIVSNPELVKDGDDYYYQVRLWNGSENVTYNVESTWNAGTSTYDAATSSPSTMASDANVQKGTPVSFKVSGDGIIENVKSLTDKVNAIVAYSDGRDYVGFDSGDEYKLTKDTVVIRFSSENKTGQAGDVITLAKEDRSNPGTYIDNCYVVADGDGDIEVLFIDRDGNL